MWPNNVALVSIDSTVFFSTNTKELDVKFQILFKLFLTLGATAITSGFTDGTGSIWLDNVQCSGDEARLVNCNARPIGQHNCGHIEDAGVYCTSELTRTFVDSISSKSLNDVNYFRFGTIYAF